MIGTDIINNKRVENIYKKYGEKFLNRIFLTGEIEYIKNKNNKIETMAGLYAAKEAMAKAYGTGIGKLSFKDLEIFHDKNGKPYGKIGGKILELTISNEREFSVATAFIPKFSPRIEVPEELLGVIKERKTDSHKGDCGKIAVLAGQKGMLGAAYLSSMAALRSGAGLVYNIVWENIEEAMSIKNTEAITKSFKDVESLKIFLKDMDSIAFGPAIGLNNVSVERLELILELNKPTVIDADGITLLGQKRELLEKIKGKRIILTPHMGEMARLVGKDIDYIKENKEKVAREFAKEYGVVLLLKGKGTIVTDGKEIYINSTGNPGMATAGSGDVLTGVIASLLGRGVSLFESGKMGAFIHGYAGDIAALDLGEEGLIAGDIVKSLPYAMKAIVEDSVKK